MSRFLAISALMVVACQAQGPGEPAPPARAPAATPAAPDPERLDELVERAGLQAAERVERSGERPCERAWTGVEALLRNAEKRAAAGEIHVPARDDFVAACEELPADAQRCMDLGYSMGHRDECRAVREGLAPDVRERFGRVMGRARW